MARVTGDLVGGKAILEVGHRFEFIPVLPRPYSCMGAPSALPTMSRGGNRIPRRRTCDRPLQQGPARPADVAGGDLDVPGGAPVRRDYLRLLDPQRDGLERLAGGQDEDHAGAA